MSDLAGIQAAYYAYQEAAKRLTTMTNNNHQQTSNVTNGQLQQQQQSIQSIHMQRIQELPEFSIDMLFFISFAQVILLFTFSFLIYFID